MSTWPLVRLDECCEVVGGSTPSTSVAEYWGGSIPWATPKDLSGMTGTTISDTPRKLTEAGLRATSSSLLPVGSVLFSSRAPIGHVAINTVPMATNQGFKSLVPRPDMVHAPFLYWWLRSHRSYLEGLGNGATFKELSKSAVSRIEMPLPPVPEQRRIAEVLDSADGLRVKRREAIAQLNILTKSIFIDMFGDVLRNTHGWPALTFGELLSMPLRNGVSPSNGATVRANVLTLSAITGSAFNAAAQKEATFPNLPPANQRVDSRDLLICRGNGNRNLVGRGFFPKESMPDVVFPDTMIAARVAPDAVERSFIEHLWNSGSVRTQLESLARTTNGTFKINQDMLEGVIVAVPPLLLQRQFAQRKATIAQLETTHQSSLFQLDALFLSLQDRAFRGEL